MEPWFNTASGKKFFPLAPTPDQIDINDIAHALSQICRYGGHCKTFYSVAQHSVLVSRLVPSWAAKYGLLHDAAEAYVGDVVRPIKRLIPRHSEIEAEVMEAIYKSLHVLPLRSGTTRAIIKHFDNVALLMERRDVMPPDVDNTPWIEDGTIDHPLPTERIVPLSPQVAKEEFLHRWNELKNSS